MISCPFCGKPASIDSEDLRQIRGRFRVALLWGLQNGFVTPDDILLVLAELVESKA